MFQQLLIDQREKTLQAHILATERLGYVTHNFTCVNPAKLFESGIY